MEPLEVSGAVRLIYRSLGVKGLKYAYQPQQGDKPHHTKHTTTHRKVTLMLRHPSLQNKTTDVVIHQHSHKLPKMDILMSETC